MSLVCSLVCLPFYLPTLAVLFLTMMSVQYATICWMDRLSVSLRRFTVATPCPAPVISLFMLFCRIWSLCQSVTVIPVIPCCLCRPCRPCTFPNTSKQYISFE